MEKFWNVWKSLKKFEKLWKSLKSVEKFEKCGKVWKMMGMNVAAVYRLGQNWPRHRFKSRHRVRAQHSCFRHPAQHRHSYLEHFFPFFLLVSHSRISFQDVVDPSHPFLQSFCMPRLLCPMLLWHFTDTQNVNGLSNYNMTMWVINIHLIKMPVNLRQHCRLSICSYLQG